jgi:HAD superfamily hydrolase (TIGR01509 family)
LYIPGFCSLEAIAAFTLKIYGNRHTFMPLKTVIFDMDGVIINSEPIYFALENEMFFELGISVSPEEHRTFVGMPDHDMWLKLKAKHRLPQALDDLIADGRRRFREHLERHGEQGLVPGAFEAAARLRNAGIRLAIASSSTREVIGRVRELYKLDRLFDVVVSGEDVSRGKPSPDIFLKAADLTKTNHAGCLVIEDSGNGVAAAKAAAMKCVGFKNPDSGNQDLSAADLVVDSLNTLTVERCRALFRSARSGPASQ